MSVVRRLKKNERRKSLRGVVALCVVASACSGSERGEGAPPQPETFNVNDLSPSSHPVGSEWRYRYSWASPVPYYERSYALFQEATRVCMDSVGFDYQPVPYFNTDELYVLLNPLNADVAQSLGYRVPQLQEPADPNSSETADFFDALARADGCGNTALRFAYEGPASSAFSTAFGSLVPEVERVIGGFPATEGASSLLAEWSSCMKALGYQYSSPTEAAHSFVDGPGPTRGEIEVALSDVGCDQQVGLTQARSAFETAAVSAWIESNALAVAELDDLVDAALKEAIDRLAQLSSEGPAVLPRPAPGPGIVTESTPPTTSPG